jgi:hypothetical protein
MSRVTAAASSLLLTMACAATPAEPEQVPVHGGSGGVACQAARGQALVGREATAALGAEALRLTGSRTLRWLRPGDIVTMDYREDRLNIEIDAGNRVRALRCG